MELLTTSAIAAEAVAAEAVVPGVGVGAAMTGTDVGVLKGEDADTLEVDVGTAADVGAGVGFAVEVLHALSSTHMTVVVASRGTRFVA